MKVIFAFADISEQEMNTSFWRCVIPANRMQEEGGHETMATHLAEIFVDKPAPSIKKFLDAAEAIVVERTIINPFMPKIREWQKAGKFVVGTFDDAYRLIDPMKGTGGYWRGKKTGDTTGNAKEFRQNLGKLDRVIVPSEVLADDYRRYCQDMRVVYNYTHPEIWKNARPRVSDRNIVIGWGGSSGHVQSWLNSGIIAALGRLANERPEIVVMIYGGGLEIPDALNSAGVHCVFEGWQPFEQWPRHIAQFDIGIAPLDGEYDRRRSYIKALEYGMAGIPWVATDMEPYHGVPGGILVKNKAKAWYRALLSLVKDKDRREKLGSTACEWAIQETGKCIPVYESALRRSG